MRARWKYVIYSDQKVKANQHKTTHSPQNSRQKLVILLPKMKFHLKTNRGSTYWSRPCILERVKPFYYFSMWDPQLSRQDDVFFCLQILDQNSNFEPSIHLDLMDSDTLSNNTRLYLKTNQRSSSCMYFIRSNIPSQHIYFSVNTTK